jgi:molecular chaperone HtpG
VEGQFSFIESAKAKGYDVLIMDDVLSTPLINNLEQKFSDKKFVRVDSDVVEKLIKKDVSGKEELSFEQKEELSPVFQAVCPEVQGTNFIVDFQDLGENETPMVITRNEFMRRMKDMSQIQPGMNFYGDMPERLNLVVNFTHPLVKKVIDKKAKQLDAKLEPIVSELSVKKIEVSGLEKLKEGKKEEEVPQADIEKLNDLNKLVAELEEKKRSQLTDFGKKSKIAKQMVDLALLANGMLKGENLNKFVKRSVELIK